MGQPIHYPIRERIVFLKSQGHSIKEISAELQLSFWTIRHLLRRHRDRGDKGLGPDYSRCGAKGQVRSNAFFYRVSCWLKRCHEDWGAPFIHLKLSQRYPESCLPSARQMQRWFRSKGLNEPRRRNAEPKANRVDTVHDCWQVDAKERLTMGDGQQGCYLSIVDERSGGALEGIFFPPPPNQPD
ncbi:MAG: hypothetical protein ABL856_03355 [Gallionella sp.]